MLHCHISKLLFFPFLNKENPFFQNEAIFEKVMNTKTYVVGSH